MSTWHELNSRGVSVPHQRVEPIAKMILGNHVPMDLILVSMGGSLPRLVGFMPHRVSRDIGLSQRWLTGGQQNRNRAFVCFSVFKWFC